MPSREDHGLPPRAASIYEYLRTQILDSNRNYLPDSKIPSRETIGHQFQMSPRTVSEAVAALVSEGFLRTKDGAGTWVCRRDSWPESPGQAQAEQEPSNE